MANFLIRNRHLEWEGCNLVRTTNDVVLRWILELGERRTNVDFDLLGSAFAYAEVVSSAHVLANVLGEVIAGNLNALIAHDAAKRNHCNLRAAAAYVDNHVAFWSFNVESNAKCSSHRLINHVYVATASVVRRVAYSAYFNFRST